MSGIVRFVDEEPIRLYVALAEARPSGRQIMITVLGIQRLTSQEHLEDIIQLVKRQVASLHQFEIPSELPGILKLPGH